MYYIEYSILLKEKGGWRTLHNGPGCQLQGEVTSPGECAKAAAELGFKGNVITGSFGHAPKGCFVDNYYGDWKHTYFNSRKGKTGQTHYKSICKIQIEG